jgi:hypothetical protein
MIKLFISALGDWSVLKSYTRGGWLFTKYMLTKRKKVNAQLEKQA